MASLACIRHTIVLAPCSKDAYTSFLWTNILSSRGKEERRGAHCPRGSSILPRGHQEVCCGGGNSPLSTEYGSPCPRGVRHVRDEGVLGPGRPSCSEGRRAARPSEPVTFARRRGAVRSHSKPSGRGARGPEAPAVGLSVSRTGAPGLGPPWGPSPERPTSTASCLSSAPSPPPQETRAGPRGEPGPSAPRARTRPPTPTPPGLVRGEEPDSRRRRLPRARLRPGPREVARSRAPEGPAHFRLLPRAPRPPHPLPVPGINSGH